MSCILFLSVLYFSLGISYQSKLINRTVFKNDRRLAECKYNSDAIGESNTYDLDFHIFDIETEGSQYCTDPQKRRNEQPYHIYFAENGHHRTYGRLKKIFEVRQNSTGFYLEMKPDLSPQTMNKYCYVCDKVPKREGANLDDPKKPTSSIQAWGGAYRILYIEPPQVERFGPPEAQELSNEIATPSKAGSVERLHGADLKLRCSASGQVESLNIKRGSEIVASSAESGSLTVELELKDLKFQHTALYTCTASVSAPDVSVYREYQSSSMSVQVNVGYPPKFEIYKRIYYTAEGAEENLKVKFRANPAPDFKCDLVDNIEEPRKVQSEYSESMSTITVTIPKVQVKDEGEFNCTASNKWGTESLTFELRLKPGDINITSDRALHSNYVKLDWQVRTNGNAPIQSYKITVKYLDKKQKEWNMLGTPLVVNSFNNKDNKLVDHHNDKEIKLGAHHLFGLRADSEHSVELVARNKYGDSQPVEKKFLTKAEGEAFKDPQTVVEPVVDHGQGYPNVACRPSDSATLLILLCLAWQRLI